MRIAVFDTHPYDRLSLDEANQGRGHELRYLEARLTLRTVALAADCEGVCPFVNDQVDRPVLTRLVAQGTRFLALRSAGFDHVDVGAAEELGLPVARVPGYSPHAVAEHAVALLLCLDRKLHRAHNRVREGNFSLHGLVGFDLVGRTVGVLGTGRIGAVFARIMQGFGCRVLAHDPCPDAALMAQGVSYTSLDELLGASDVVSLHLPLCPATRHLIDAAAMERMKRGAYLINTGRGGLVDSEALIRALKTRQLAGAGLDVYEREAGLFFEDLSDVILEDDVLARLLTFPNVIITGHQAYLTAEALAQIACSTLDNLEAMAAGQTTPNLVTRGMPRPPRI